MEERLCGRDLACSEARGRRIGVGVERRIIDGTAAGPEAGGADLMRIGLACNGIREAGDAAGVQGRGAAREAGDSQVETAPEQMHRTDLAEKARAEELEHAVDFNQRTPEADQGVGIVGFVHGVACERYRIAHLAWTAAELGANAEILRQRDEAPVEFSNRHRL